MSEHSPTPWKFGFLGTDEHDDDMWIGCEGWGLIANVPTRRIHRTNDAAGNPRSAEEQVANCKHIVHCVNLHDELVAALQQADYYVKDSAECGEHGAGLLHDGIKELLARAKA
jgi:hypothetical protein